MSETWRPTLTIGSKTDVGMRRSNNQDSLSLLPAKSAKRFASHGHLFIVADGMGAHAAGELASGMATEQIAMNYYRQQQSIVANLHSALVEANREIHDRGRSNPEFHQMGTTVSSLVLATDGAWIGHVGDSRVYRLRGARLEQLTFDHSLAWEVAATGQSNLNVPRNVITRSLGPSSEVEVDLEGPFDLQAGDRYLLCSDGLTGPVEDTELGTLLHCLPPQTAVDVLVDLANLRGGPDNITIVVVEVGAAECEGVKMPNKEPAPYPRTLIATSVICLAAALGLFLFSVVGPAIIALILAIVVGVIAAVQTTRDQAGKRRGRGSGDGVDPVTRGGAPYRRYDAKPTKGMYEKLGQTISDLRQAADERGWQLNWRKVDKLTLEGDQLAAKSQWSEAIATRSKAIVETMNELRRQNDRASGETAID
ncbi:MAG: protein phosphatase 2C domain-containing protein [Planctomycetota bacterium]